MEIFGMFKNIDFVLIAKYMVAELFLGIVVGIILKYVLKFNASRASDVRVFPIAEYSSVYFGRNFPRGAFDLFKLPPEFVIVRYSGNEMISEKFFTSLGDSIQAEYQDGQYCGHGFSALSSPVYLFTVVVPCLFGFFPALLPFLNKVGTPLLMSGVAWLFITSWVPMFLAPLSSEDNS